MNERAHLDFDRLAARMLRDYDAHTPGTLFAEGVRLSLDEAQILQDTVARLRTARGERVVGYKIGCVCQHNQQRNGLQHPVRGRLWSSEQHADGVTLSRADFAGVAIEGEFAVTLSRDIDAGDRSLETIAASVERIFPVIELHNVVFRGGDPQGPELIANNAIHSGVVRGNGCVKPAKPTMTNLAIRFDGDIVDQWEEIRWPDDVLQAVYWLTGSLAQSGLHLQRGQTILTGALGPPLPVAHVHHVEVLSSQFGSVEARFQ
jgi:2-keto-4-pentenoate hydratase